MIGCFVTGTDTAVGKTVVTAALAYAIRERGLCVVALKPIETGVEEAGRKSDVDKLHAVAPCHDMSGIPHYRLRLPVAPLTAARAAGVSIDVDLIVDRIAGLTETDVVLVEGVGGLLVPLTEGANVRTLIERLAFPVVVVGRAALGGVNHALLTLEALRRTGRPILALVLNTAGKVMRPVEGEQVASTVDLLRGFSGVPVLGPLDHDPALETAWRPGIEQLARSPAIVDLADRVLKGAE